MWHCLQSFPACESSVPRQGLPGVRFTSNFSECQPSLGRRNPASGGRRASPAPAAAEAGCQRQDLHSGPISPMCGEMQGKDTRGCATHPARGMPEPADRPGNPWARPDAPKATPGSYRGPGSALGAPEVVRGERLAPRLPRQAHGSGSTSRAPSRHRRAGPGRAAHGTRRPAGDVAPRLPPARDPGRKLRRAGPRAAPPPPRPPAPSRGPRLTAPRRGFVPSGVASPASAQRQSPFPAPLPPGRAAPPEPSPRRARRAIRAGGRRAAGCAAAASGGASPSRAGGGGRGVGEPGGGRGAAGARAQPEGGGNRNVTGARGGEDGEGEMGTPSPCRTPTSGRRLPAPPLPGRAARGCARPSCALPRPPGLSALTCSGSF